MDIISSSGIDDDVSGVTITDPVGKNCGTGLLEIKLDEGGGSLKNWPIRNIAVSGGEYRENGTEVTGIYIADRVREIVLDGQVIYESQIGMEVANPARHILLRNFTSFRSCKEGIKWVAGRGLAKAASVKTRYRCQFRPGDFPVQRN